MDMYKQSHIAGPVEVFIGTAIVFWAGCGVVTVAAAFIMQLLHV